MIRATIAATTVALSFPAAAEEPRSVISWLSNVIDEPVEDGGSFPASCR